MSTRGAGASRGGGDLFHNEDVFLVEDALGLYVVCDGVGASPAGEVAARIATEALEDFVARSEQDADLASGRASRLVVERAMRQAMLAISEADEANPEFRGLGTTVTLLLAQRDLGVIGHRGDSRAYLIRRGRCRQLTLDHELTDAPLEGAGGDDRPFDVLTLDLEAMDTIVLCTDGAEQVVEDDAVVKVAASLSPRLLASRIVTAAHRTSPDEDATAVVIRVSPEHERRWLDLSLPSEGSAFGRTLSIGTTGVDA